MPTQSKENEPEEHIGDIELPFVKIPVRDHYIARHPVTQKVWTSIMGTAPWKRAETGDEDEDFPPRKREYAREDDDFPATFISWNDCREFLDRLNAEKVGEAYRFPTVDEWEHACRAGSTTEYSFGDDAALLGEYGWFMGNTYEVKELYAHRVARKKANPWGLYDMHGNVWEWCEEWRPYYEDVYRMVCGGAWGCTAEYCVSVSRGGMGADRRFNNIGFRPVISAAHEGDL